MKTKLLLTLFLSFFLAQMHAQKTSGKQLVRSTMGVSGSSETIKIKNKTYVVQQSIGQSSAIGTFVSGGLVLRQGFIQPNATAKIVSKTPPTNLQAIVYPNPFFESISLSFNEEITSKISVEVFDTNGRTIYAEDFKPSQKLDIGLGQFPESNYILMVKANDKQFVKKIIKN